MLRASTKMRCVMVPDIDEEELENMPVQTKTDFAINCTSDS
jgi:hypothetical protein